jgi:hypothetical protein
MAARKGKGSLVWAQPAQLRLPSGADLRCPNCNSTDLRKVSLAYQEGLFRTVAHTRLRAVVVGGSGPDLFVARATTRGFQVRSKHLSPPVKWSYRRLIFWWVLALLCVGWIVFYVNTVSRNSSVVLSTPLILFALFSAIVFVLLFVLVWRHNESTYKRQYSEWERSFLCQRCGALTEQDRLSPVG